MGRQRGAVHYYGARKNHVMAPPLSEHFSVNACPFSLFVLISRQPSPRLYLAH